MVQTGIFISHIEETECDIVWDKYEYSYQDHELSSTIESGKDTWMKFKVFFFVLNLSLYYLSAQ